MQKKVAHSTTEAVFKALATGVSYSLWIKALIKELTKQKLSLTLKCDNQCCLAALKGKNHKGRSKANLFTSLSGIKIIFN